MRDRLLIVGVSKSERDALSLTLATDYTVLHASNSDDVKRTAGREKPAAVLLDLGLTDGSASEILREIKWDSPNSLIIVITPGVDAREAAVAMTDGADDFIGRPIDLRALRIRMDFGVKSKARRLLRAAKRTELPGYFSFNDIIGRSREMRDVVELAKKIADRDVSPVLLQGESGTGKDCLAKAMHFSSGHADAPFIAINCAAIPEHLIESELFGHEKGAFTDAKCRKEGLLEQAKGGTVFLDEIGDLATCLQAKLLRVIEEGSFRRVGGLKNISFDARVVAASNHDLKKEVADGRFRLDLYHRLAVIQLDIAPLRRRGGDILLLADYFVGQFAQRLGRNDVEGLSAEAADAFMNYDWPGNVRELKNAIERATVLEDGSLITTKYLPNAIVEPHSAVPDAVYPMQAKRTDNNTQFPFNGLTFDKIEASCIDSALTQTGGNLSRAARMLGMSRDKMRYRIKKSGLRESAPQNFMNG